MNVELFGVLIHEFDVVVTDLLLGIESFLFAYLLYKRASTQTVLRNLLVVLFLALGASSLLGAVFHAFFPAKATMPGGFAVWMFVTASIGVTACSVWCINGLVLKGNKFLKQILPFVIVYFVALMYAVAFINYEFKMIILFYTPPMVVLALSSAVNFFRSKNISWLGVFGGVVLSFVAAGFQFLQVNIHPVYFNFNALYHVVQGLSLFVIFISFSRILKLKA